MVGKVRDLPEKEPQMALILIVFALGNKRIVPPETSKPPRVTLGTAFAIHIACRVSAQMKSGARTSVIVLSSLIRTWSDGPAVSLNGSPTVSPTTAAL